VSNTKPFQILAGPAKAFVAPTGTAFPSVSTPTTSFGTVWQPLGMTEGGVKISHTQTVVELRVDQSTAPIKAIRSEENLQISFNIAELTLEHYAAAVNQAIAGPNVEAGDENVNLYRGGSQVETVALLIRGDHLSPYGDFNLQYEVPAVFEAGNPEVDFTRDNKSVLALSYHAVADPNRVTDSAAFGVLRAGNS
jgi:hypothetical protein